MPQDNEQEQLNKLISLIQEALKQDEQLRQTYQVGEKFRFIRDRLHTLLERVENEAAVKEKKTARAQAVKLNEDEVVVYIHLYNAHGAVFRTWQTIINPKAFFDFSVNRPIYRDKDHIEAFIRSKANKAQHAYLMVAIKKNHILPGLEEVLKDSLGNPLIKLKEGSLHYERALSFVHNEQVYTINEEGDLVTNVP